MINLNQFKVIVFALIAYFFLSGSSSSVGLGDERYLVSVSKETPIEKEKLEAEWLKATKSLCPSADYSFTMGEAKIDESVTLIIDRGSKKVVEPETSLKVQLIGAVHCQ